MPVVNSAVPRRARLFDFRSGGWVLLASAVMCCGIVLWHLARILPTLDHRAVGDGTNVESYQFDLTNLLVPRELVVASGQPKDSWPAMIDPPTIRAGDIGPDRKLAGVRALRSTERVIGVTIHGESRAYPHWILCWHEVVNDTLGGSPILVTYNPLCDSSVVFDRRIAGEERAFGVSGLLFNSNTLIYDRTPDGHGESLWSQLQFRAIAGPAAARADRLEVLPARVVTWAEWLAKHPDTTVLLPQPARTRVYKRDAFLPYFGDDRLLFPVAPALPADLRPKEPIIAIRDGGRWRTESAATFDLSQLKDDDRAVWCFAFAWHAMRE